MFSCIGFLLLVTLRLENRGLPRPSLRRKWGICSPLWGRSHTDGCSEDPSRRREGSMWWPRSHRDAFLKPLSVSASRDACHTSGMKATVTRAKHIKLLKQTTMKERIKNPWLRWPFPRPKDLVTVSNNQPHAPLLFGRGWGRALILLAP